MRQDKKPISIKRNPIGLLCLALLLSVPPVFAQDEVKYSLSINSYLDFGHLVSGYSSEALDEIKMLPLNRGNVTLTPHLMLGNSFDVLVGITGLIWWPYATNNVNPPERVMRVKPMVPIARGKWKFGEPDGFNGYLQFGTFPYKYNMEAKNLGEYLYRSGTYPGFLFTTEGWLFMNRAGFYAHGAQMRLNHLNGMLTHNFSLFMEMVYYPIGDFSPGYDFSLKFPFFELGGGMVLNHYLPIRPSLLTSDEGAYQYVSITQDPSAFPQWHDYTGPRHLNPEGASVEDSAVTVLDEYTHKGIKLMGRATLNLNSLLPEAIASPDDLKLFAEVAVLGWDDKEFFYENRSERTPIMLGINIPTFKLLDLLSIQLEHYSSPFNDISEFNLNSNPIWRVEGFEDSLTVRNNALYFGFYDDRDGDSILTVADSLSALQALDNWHADSPNHEDDWKWSIYAKKKLNNHITVYSQVASDHFRLIDQSLTTSAQPLTSSPKEWYYLLRVEFGIK